MIYATSIFVPSPTARKLLFNSRKIANQKVDLPQFIFGPVVLKDSIEKGHRRERRREREGKREKEPCDVTAAFEEEEEGTRAECGRWERRKEGSPETGLNRFSSQPPPPGILLYKKKERQ